MTDDRLGIHGTTLNWINLFYLAAQRSPVHYTAATV